MHRLISIEIAILSFVLVMGRGSRWFKENKTHSYGMAFITYAVHVGRGYDSLHHVVMVYTGIRGGLYRDKKVQVKVTTEHHLI